MKKFTDPAILQKWCANQKKKGNKIALVPTMGYLHEGHLSLIREAKKRADIVVVSVFVNPVQFGPNEDYDKYPRDEKADWKKCREAGASAVFFPTKENMYLDRHSVYINEEDLSLGLCGARRPGHFRGVCTVVAKLFNLSHCDIAIFGQKDYQQAQVIKRMVRDLNFDLEIVVMPIVREKSGLAMSSRNTYLDEDMRKKALVLSEAVRTPKAGDKTAVISKKCIAKIEKAGLKIDYFECVDGATLVRSAKIKQGDAILVAAFAGKTRLIDNSIVK